MKLKVILLVTSGLIASAGIKAYSAIPSTFIGV